MRGFDVDAAKRATYRYINNGPKWANYMNQSKTSKNFFGPFFEKDLKIVQKHLGLNADGVFGEKTLRALEKVGAFDWVARRLWQQQYPEHCQPIPAGIDYKIVGYPNQGTHRQSDWQSRNALDWEAPAGTPVLAPITGEVIRVGGSNGIRYVGGKIIFGQKLTIDPPSGPECFLTHLANTQVTEGQLVLAGEVLAVIGNYGIGSHVHVALQDPANVQAMLSWPKIPLDI